MYTWGWQVRRREDGEVILESNDFDLLLGLYGVIYCELEYSFVQVVRGD